MQVYRFSLNRSNLAHFLNFRKNSSANYEAGLFNFAGVDGIRTPFTPDLFDPYRRPDHSLAALVGADTKKQVLELESR